MTHVPLILVADDVAANVELLNDQLSMLGYRVISAGDGPSAVEMCFAHKPDLCILDVAMPAGSLRVDDRSTGFEVCRRLKRDPRTERIPVIFVTALNDTTDRVKAIEAGGDDFLTKPHNRQILSARVRSLLRLKFATDALDDSYRKLRELEKVRDDLMKMIVHDLKTPLTSVLASLEMALDGDLGQVSETQRRVLGDAESKAEDLLGLIGDLLEVARIEENAIDLDLSPIAPGAFVAEIVHEWDVRFQLEGAKVFLDVAEDAPVINADKGLLKRVFANLIQNALTHTRNGVEITNEDPVTRLVDDVTSIGRHLGRAIPRRELRHGHLEANHPSGHCGRLAEMDRITDDGETVMPGAWRTTLVTAGRHLAPAPARIVPMTTASVASTTATSATWTNCPVVSNATEPAA